MRASVVTFFMQNDKKEAANVTGIGITDALIERLKNGDGVIMQDGTADGAPTAILLVYAPTEAEVIAKAQEVTKTTTTEVRIKR